MKKWSLAVLATVAFMGCNGNQTTAPILDAVPTPGAASPAPEIGTFTFEEIDLLGCGMTLWQEGTDFRADGIYLFSGWVDPETPPRPDGFMRMRLDGEIVRFIRTETAGEAIPGGQYLVQRFVSEDGDITVAVEVGSVDSGIEPESNPIPDAAITVTRAGQETTLKTIGNTGC
jgi:hypothetical protein